MTYILAELMIWTGGFLFGIVCSAWVMGREVEKTRDKIFKENSEARRLMPRYQHAVTVAAKCWCDPRTVNIKMDTTLGIVFAEKIAEYTDALQWCSGSDDFSPGGKAWIGFERICRPLMSIGYKIDVTRLTVEQYKNLRKNAPELLGL